MAMTLAKANKVEMIRRFARLTPQMIVDKRFPSIARLKREHQGKVDKVIRVMLSDLYSSFGEAARKEEVEELVAEITASSLKNLSLEDIYVTCRMIKQSPSFGKLNVNKFLVQLNKHYQEKLDKVAKRSLNEHLQSKGDTGFESFMIRERGQGGAAYSLYRKIKEGEK